MVTNWTTLYVKLNGEMKRIGNVNPKTGAVSLYSEGYKYYDSPDLYYVNTQGLYRNINSYLFFIISQREEKV